MQLVRRWQLAALPFRDHFVVERPERGHDRGEPGQSAHVEHVIVFDADDGGDPALPATPDAGFWGRDETLLALDRAFDTHPIVLLHAYAGSGKTATAAEFARWYALTGGVEGPVLFTEPDSLGLGAVWTK